MTVLSTNEMRLGAVILVLSFISLDYSSLSMQFPHALIIIIASVFLLALIINLFILTRIPHQGKLRMITKEDKIFEHSYDIFFVSVYFCLITIMVGLLANAMKVDRAQNILLISMLITTFYNMIICIWLTHNFIKLSNTVDKENVIHDYDFSN